MVGRGARALPPARARWVQAGEAEPRGLAVQRMVQRPEWTAPLEAQVRERLQAPAQRPVGSALPVGPVLRAQPALLARPAQVRAAMVVVVLVGAAPRVLAPPSPGALRWGLFVPVHGRSRLGRRRPRLHKGMQEFSKWRTCSCPGRRDGSDCWCARRMWVGLVVDVVLRVSIAMTFREHYGASPKPIGRGGLYRTHRAPARPTARLASNPVVG